MFARISLLFILFFVFSSIVFSQSCIIYKKEKDGIFVGADSRMISYSMNESTKRIEPGNFSICKIDHLDSIHFAITGHATNIALSEATRILQSTKPFLEAVNVYVTSFGQKLADMLETTRHVNPKFYKNNFPTGIILSGSIFFYYENEQFIGRVVKITLVSQPFEKALVLTHNDAMDSIGVAGNGIGTRNILFNNDVWKKGAVKGINNLIGIEKMANPTQVEGVVDILFVSSKNKIEWLQRNKCQ